MTTSTNPTPLDSLPPTDPLEITNGLTLSPRIKLHLTIHRITTVVSTIDEWKLKRSLIDFLKTSFSHPITISDEDLQIRRFKDINKRTRDHPVARGKLFIRDLGFVVTSAKQVRDDDDEFVRVLERKFCEWRKVIVEKMDGMEVNLEGVRFRVSVSVPVSDDFERLKKEWDEFYAFGAGANRGHSRGGRQEPDTIILRGLPSRWFAEPRVSSKPSMLVTHTIFSTFGKIRNLNVAEDNDLGKDTDEDDGDIVSGLHCKVVVQFEKYRDFYNAMKVFCSRSLHKILLGVCLNPWMHNVLSSNYLYIDMPTKEGSRMKADYEVTWDKDGFFQSVKRRIQDRTHRGSALGDAQYRSEDSRRQTYSSRYSPDNIRPKRFKE